MDLPVLLAQEQAQRLLQRWFEREPAWLSIPVYVVGVVLLAWLVERIVVALLRRMSRRTETKIDDAFSDGLPMLIRPLFALMGAQVVVQQLLRNDKDPTKLSPEGELATKALMVVSILVLAVAIARLASRMIEAWVHVDASRAPVGPPLKLGVKIALVPLALLTALQAVDYPVTSLITALGIGSLAVGLALQDTLKNMFAGIQIVLDRPIRAGDFVEVDKNAKGTVIEIGLRSTKLRSGDNNIVIIPNATIAGAMVTNFDVQDRSYIETFHVSVAYGVDTRRAQAILEEVVSSAQKELHGVSDEPAEAIVSRLGDSSIDFSIPVKFRQFAGKPALVSEIYHRICERFRAEEIEIPFPTRTVYLRGEQRVSENPVAPRA
jgi:small-conductance mechanosensitive channel